MNLLETHCLAFPSFFHFHTPSSSWEVIAIAIMGDTPWRLNASIVSPKPPYPNHITSLPNGCACDSNNHKATNKQAKRQTKVDIDKKS